MIAQKEQLYSVIQKFYPHVTIASEVSQTQLFEMLNSMSVNTGGNQYDPETFKELIQRCEQFYKVLTINNYLDVHIQAVNILNFRIESLKNEQRSIDIFLQRLQNRINELSQSRVAQNNHFIQFKTITLKGQIPNYPLLMKIYTDDQQQTIPFQNSGNQLFIQFPQMFDIKNLGQSFTIEIVDSYQNVIAYSTLNVFQFSISQDSKIVLPQQYESVQCALTLEVEGHVDITHSGYANEDYVGLKEQQVQINMDLTSSIDQLRDLSSPFENINRSFRQPSHNPSFYNQPNQYPVTSGMGAQNIAPYYQEDGFGGAQVHQTTKGVNVNGGVQPDHHLYTSNGNEDCDFNSKSLVRNLHYLLIIYLVCSVIFCVKRSMFLDVTIAMSLLAITYRHDLSAYNKGQDILKLYIALFVISASIDLAWLIVYFPSWNRDITSEDQGAQGVLRIIILGASLLFMIYKVLMIISIIFLNKDLNVHGFQSHQQIQQFFQGKDFQTRPSHVQITNPNMIH